MSVHILHHRPKKKNPIKFKKSVISLQCTVYKRTIHQHFFMFP